MFAYGLTRFVMDNPEGLPTRRLPNSHFLVYGLKT
jgi:hypothetical protein